MLLNQMRSEESDPEVLLRQSFYQFQSDRSLPKLKKQLKDLEDERDSIVIEDEEKLKEYYSLLKQWRDFRSTIRDIVFAPKHCLPFLQPGRIVRILGSSTDGVDEEALLAKEEKGFWGVVVNSEKMQSAGKVESKTYRKAVPRIEAIESMIADHVMARSPTLKQQLKTLYKKVKLNAAIQAARGEVRTASTLVFKDELKAQKRVLCQMTK